MKRAVITGGTGTVGQAIATALAAPDWQVLAPGSRDLDVGDPVAVRRYFEDHPSDLLVCAAGFTDDQLIARTRESVWDQIQRINFHGAAHCARAALSHMRSCGCGHIVFISSHSALHPPAGQAAYAAAKASLLGLTTDLAVTYGADNIRVNAVLPGFIPSRMTAGVGEARRGAVLAEHELGRFNTPECVGKFIRHLHHEMPHTSGQIFRLDSRISPP